MRCFLNWLLVQDENHNLRLFNLIKYKNSNEMDRYFWRQLFILLAALLTSISGGVTISFPGILNPALLSPGSDITATHDQASWLAAINALAGIPGFIFMPMIMQAYGRKVVYFCLSLPIMTGWILMVCAKNLTTLFIARIVQGIFVGSIIITVVIISEYSHPKRRGYFIVMSKTFLAAGVLLCHTFCLFWTWRQIAGFCISLNLLAMIFVIFWPESPAYLAMKGRFEECEKSFIWLYGRNLESRKELLELIAAQKEIIKNKQKLTVNQKIVTVMKKFTQKDFLKALCITILMAVSIEALGRHYLMVYLVQIMTEVVGGDETLGIYFSIGNDSLTTIAFVLATVVIQHFKRRTILLSFGPFAVSLMFLLSALLFLEINLGPSQLIVAVIVLFFSFLTNIGIMPLVFTLLGEIFPLEHRGAGTSVAGIAMSSVFGLTLKVIPIIMESVGLSGMFLICALLATFCFSVLYFVLPETKDRTLQDIELEMKGLKSSVPELKPMIDNVT